MPGSEQVLLHNDFLTWDTSPLAAQPYTLPVRVYYEDTDAAGVVYYANYLRYLERARTEWLASIGHPLPEVERAHGIVFVVHRLEIDYHAPARLYDALDVSVDIDALRRASLDLRQEVRRDGTVLVAARVVLACVDRVAFRPARIPIQLDSRSDSGARSS